MSRSFPGNPQELLHNWPRSAIIAVLAVAICLLMPRAVNAQEDFTPSVTPQPVTLTTGGTPIAVTVTTTVLRAFTEPITYSFSGLPAGISTGGAQTVLPPYAPVTFMFAATASVAEGTYAGSLVASISGRIVTFPATVIVTTATQPTPPVIQSVSPPSVASGTTENVLRITGRNFDRNAVVTSRSAGVQVTRTRILSATTAEVVVSVRSDATPGAIRLDLQNPDGGTAAGGARLVVYPARSLGAPLAVTAASIVTPRQWEIVEPGDQVYARALLATSGMGTVVGTWLLDGVPFDRFTSMVSSGFPVEIKSAIPIPPSFTGEHRLELVIESPQSMPARRVSFIQALERRSKIRVLTPGTGAFVSPAAAVFRWTLVPGASGYEVEIEGVPNDSAQIPHAPLRRRLTETEWHPDKLLEELGPGEKRFRVRAVFPGEVEGDATPWQTFTVGPLEGGIKSPEEKRTRGSSIRLGALGAMPNLLSLRTADPSRAAAAWYGASHTASQDLPAASSGQLDLTVNSTTTTFATDVADPPTTTRLQLSNQMDFRVGRFESQATTDLSGSFDLGDPWRGEAENKNWLASFGGAGGQFKQETRIGFAPPSFFDQTEFLSVFTSGGGVQGSLGSPIGRVSYYRSARLGAEASVARADPRIEAAAYELSNSTRRFWFRTMLLRVSEPDVDAFSAGGKGTALGFMGAIDLGPRLQLLGEVASSDLKPGADSFEEEREGQALRLSAVGTAGTFGYSLSVGWTAEGFVNPANAGFTPGGVSGRTRAELGLQKKLFGNASWSGIYSHVRGGIAEAAGDPETTENAGRMSFSVPITQHVSFTLGGNITAQRGDAFEDFDLPETDRTQKGVDLSITEVLGRLTLSQAVTWNDLTDDSYNLNNQRVTGVALTASGALTSFLNVAANVSDTRSRSVAELGTTNRLLVSLQPALSIGKLPVQLIPRAAYTWTENEVQESDVRTALYQIVARWQPSWAGSLIALEVASDWNRNWSALQPERPPFERKTLFTLSLNWRADHAWGASAE